MALSTARIVAATKSPYPHEQAGVEFAIEALPDRDPFHLWALVELLDPSTGRLHEIDLLVVGYSALYVVEMKAYPGRIEGDSVDWTWIPPDGEPRPRDNPRRLTHRKAQILASRLQRLLPPGVRAPWVEPLVFLTDPEVKVDLRAEGRTGVVTRKSFAEAITHGKYPGADPRRQSDRLNVATVRATVQALAQLGIRPRKHKLTVGSYELGELIGETDSFQDRSATHVTIRSQTCRARTYLVPEQTSVERRQQLRRAADREAQLLYEVREHPNILSYKDYVADAPVGPTVLFDAFDDSVPLDRFVRLDRDLTFLERIAIIEQVGRALDHCHRKQVVHGAVCPAAVLVRRHPVEGIETRLFNFQLGQSDAVTATSHWTDLAAAEWAVYQAPELRRDSTQRTVATDLFSLGALAYFVLTGRDPAVDVVQVEEMLRQQRCLDPSAVDDTIPEEVAEAIRLATHEVILQRADDVAAWLDILLYHATAPDLPAVPDLSPLDARKDDRLGDLLVLGTLGHGASSRVLAVERDDGRRLALKVSLGPEHDERLAAEADVLARLRHARIVQLLERRTIAGRTCLLLSMAGDHSLYHELAKEGVPSLDYASRWGEELLSALEHLEELEIIHRDIKPANLGVGTVGKKARSLHLFDFSLAAASLEDVRVGTGAYRDPSLAKRGRWDHAADRYSAAVTLHELLTATRPASGEDGATIIAAERFDASARASLVGFFDRALAPAAEDRFPSAADMRHAWIGCFDGRALPAEADRGRPVAELSGDVIRAVAPDTPIAALPLSTRARNALDRAGLLRAADLVSLPQNRLSAIRGAGREVTRDIHAFRARWQELVPASAEPGPAFFPGYHGEDFILETALLADAAAVLVDAGIRTLGQLAATPDEQVRALASRHGLDADAVRSRLAEENRAADERDRPTTLEGWVRALFGGKRKAYDHVRALFGLSGPRAGALGLAPREIAEALEQTAANLYIALGKAREAWARHPAFHRLAEAVRGFVAAEGGAAPLEQAADWLLTQLAHDAAADPAAERLRAAALVRAVCEVERDQPGGLRFVRLGGERPWVLADSDLQSDLRRLGAAADALAARPVLAGEGETERALHDELEPDSGLARVARERLIRLAAAASDAAAASPRLELYPRAMPAARALELSAAALTGGLTPDELRARVAARYPAAEPLPDRPALDTLVHGHGLEFESTSGRYLRKGDGASSSMHTSYQSYTRLTGQPAARPVTETEVVAGDFEHRVRTCLERRSLLVLGVSLERAEEAARALAARFSLERRSFDAAFLAALDAKVAEDEIDPDIVHETDAAGPAAEGWRNLTSVCEAAAARVASALLPPARPLLLTEPGLLHRYQLKDFLHALVEASRRDDSAAILVLVPGHEGGTPAIEGQTVIPGLLPGQMTWLPKAWLAAHSRPSGGS